ncbi:hypothetical protein BC833DRAFT_616726 [Globomyces pollinis-pini]|nr:hypothetical protein BC833DRAFT_616726 [Globomyces pollinis-pini]
MSYNGIGLSTARGTGTNGFVQRNLSYLKPRQVVRKDVVNYMDAPEHQLSRPANMEILDHERKRLVEIKCLELEDELTEKGLDEDEVEVQVEALRTKLLQNMDEMKEEHVKMKDWQVHHLAEAKERQNKKFEDAFGIKSTHKHGASFDRETQEQKKLDRENERQRRNIEMEENRRNRYDREKEDNRERERRPAYRRSASRSVSPRKQSRSISPRKRSVSPPPSVKVDRNDRKSSPVLPKSPPRQRRRFESPPRKREHSVEKDPEVRPPRRSRLETSRRDSRSPDGRDTGRGRGSRSRSREVRLRRKRNDSSDESSGSASDTSSNSSDSNSD